MISVISNDQLQTTGTRRRWSKLARVNSMVHLLHFVNPTRILLPTNMVRISSLGQLRMRKRNTNRAVPGCGARASYRTMFSEISARWSLLWASDTCRQVKKKKYRKAVWEGKANDVHIFVRNSRLKKPWISWQNRGNLIGSNYPGKRNSAWNNPHSKECLCHLVMIDLIRELTSMTF